MTLTNCPECGNDLNLDDELFCECIVDTWIVLVFDPESKKWNVLVNTPDEAAAREFEEHCDSPCIVICTADFLQNWKDSK